MDPMLPIPDNAIDDANVSKPAPGLTPRKPPEAMVPTTRKQRNPK